MILFLVPGHSKFAPDALFSKIGNTFNTHDVFNLQELAGIVERYALCTTFTHNSMLSWKDHFSLKYQPFKGIKSYKDFRIKLAVNQKPVLLYRQHQYEGNYSTVCKMTEKESVQLPSSPEECYVHHRVSAEKLVHLTEMYHRYIPIDRYLLWINPPPQPAPIPATHEVNATTSNVTSEAAKEHQKTMRSKRK